MKHKIGILGGTFNPIHLGHIELGRQVASTFALYRVLYVLSARPPHKRQQFIPLPAIRWQMLCAALRPYPVLVPCDIEIQRKEKSWTIDTVAELQRRAPDDLLFFITGSEGFLKIRTWKEYRRLLHSVYFIIVLRRPSHRQAVAEILGQEGIPVLTDPLAEAALPAAYICSYRSPLLAVSSTRLRRRIRQKQAIDVWTSAGVRDIIKESGLYEKG